MRIEDFAVRAEIDEQAEKAEKADGDPVFGFHQGLRHRRLNSCPGTVGR